MMILTPVIADTSQGLEWGFGAGDRFDFTLISTENVWNDSIYLNVSSVPGIPDPLNSWTDVPEPSGGAYWANGTSMGVSALIFLGLNSIGGKIGLPIGNWTLLESLIEVELTGEEIIDTTYTWGIEWSYDINATHQGQIKGTYLKSDGYLAEYSLESWDTTSNTLVESILVIRDSLLATSNTSDASTSDSTIPEELDPNSIMDLIQANILIIGAGILIIILVIVILRKR